MERVGAALGSHVDHAACEPSEIGAGVAGGDAELLNCVLGRDKGNEVSAKDIVRDAVNILGALALDGAADLVVTPTRAAGGPRPLVEACTTGR